MKIGIAITTVSSRKKLLQKAIRQHRKFQPENSIIHVHEDTNRIGIARSKNKCIAYLMEQECTHLFLFDDDCYPIKKDWHKLFTDNPAPHATATFDKLSNGISNGNIRNGITGNYEYFHNPCGIVMYYTRECIEQIGGMDTRYSKYGHEHVGHSWRIFNAGLTPYPFISPIGIMESIYSLDQHSTTSSTITPLERSISCEEGRPIIREEKESKDWKPYQRESVVMGAYLNSKIDDQRKHQWKAIPEVIATWRDSARNAGFEPILFTDCFKPGQATHRQVYTRPQRLENIYNHRFAAFRDYLTKHKEYFDFVLLTDTTDVEIFAYPEMEADTIYIGSEPWTDWIYTQPMPAKMHRQPLLLNCGIIGGHISIILPFLNDMCDFMKGQQKIADMASVNHILQVEKKYNFVTGHPLHTVFKKFEQDDGEVCIRHK
jgi:hypothetical protein